MITLPGIERQSRNLARDSMKIRYALDQAAIVAVTDQLLHDEEVGHGSRLPIVKRLMDLQRLDSPTRRGRHDRGAHGPAASSTGINGCSDLTVSRA